MMLLALVAMAGCATSRSELSLERPTQSPASGAIASGKIAVIRSVKDERVFEQAPSEASTPSLGFEGAANASAETKARAIARKRGGFGKAMGDVLLESGQTVEGVVRDNLTAALTQAGYQVVGAEAAAPTALIIDVHIKQFWAWMRPGFWAITLNANITTDLELSGTSEATTINAHAEDSRQMATDSAWMAIIGEALDDYRAQVVARAATFPAGK